MKTSMHSFRSFFSVSAMTLLGRIAGYCRELIMAHWLGISAVTDALLLSLKFPAFFRRIFSEGALHTSLVPSYKMSPQKKTFSGMILFSIICIISIFLILILMNFNIVTQWMFNQSNKRISSSTLYLFSQFAPIVFPSILFLTISSFLGSIANAHHQFAGFAFSHALVSIMTIVFMMFFSLFSKNYGLIFAWSVLLGCFCQTLFIGTECYLKGFLPIPRIPKMTPEIRCFMKRFFLGFLSFSPLHMGSIFTFWMATKMPDGSISLLNYADRIIQLPTTLIGLSLGSILLPAIVDKIKNNDHLGANHMLEKAISIVSLFIFPIAVFLFCFSLPIIQILFGYSKITAHQMNKISNVVNIYSCALPAFVLNRLLVTRFFAQGHMWQPFFANIITVTIEIMISTCLVEKLAHKSIPIGVSIGMWINIITLFLLIKKKYHWNVMRTMGMYFASIFFSNIILWLFFQKLIQKIFFHVSFIGNIQKLIYLFISALLGAMLFFVILIMMKQTSFKKISSFFKA